MLVLKLPLDSNGFLQIRDSSVRKYWLYASSHPTKRLSLSQFVANLTVNLIGLLMQLKANHPVPVAATSLSQIVKGVGLHLAVATLSRFVEKLLEQCS